VLGSGVTLTTIEKHGGKLEADFDHAVATILQTAGVMLLDGTAAVTTLSGHGGKIVANLTGTITNVESYGADLDFMQSQVARIVTNLKTRGAGAIAFDPDVLTITNWLPQEAQHFQHTAA